jgi:hypothetical protein
LSGFKEYKFAKITVHLQSLKLLSQHYEELDGNAAVNNNYSSQCSNNPNCLVALANPFSPADARLPRSMHCCNAPLEQLL